MVIAAQMFWPGAATQPTASAAANADAVVRCSPVLPSGTLGDTLAVDIYVEDALNLYGIDVQLSFDTGVAEVVDADTNAAGVQIESLNSFLSPSYVVRRVADNTAGTIWYAATQFHPTVPAAGSGAVARVTFDGLSQGSFTLDFTSIKLADRFGGELPATAQDCLVTFGAGAPITTSLSPSSIMANGAGFTLTVNGQNFVDGAIVYWNGAVLTTTFINGTQLQATVLASHLTLAGPASVTVGNPAPGGGTSNAQTFTVNNRVRFSASSYTRSEGGGSAPITVTLLAPSTLTVSVTLKTSHGTAKASDYTTVNSSLTFPPGVTSRLASVPITNDVLDEPNETLLVTLSAPVNALLGSPNTATLTITDNDAPTNVRFASSVYTTTEASGSVVISVTLKAASGFTVTVNYITSNGTALAGSDYQTASGTLTFAPGQVLRTFTVAVLPDALNEPNETVVLTLSAAVNAGLGTQNPATLVIQNVGEPPPIYRLFVPFIHR